MHELDSSLSQIERDIVKTIDRFFDQQLSLFKADFDCCQSEETDNQTTVNIQAEAKSVVCSAERLIPSDNVSRMSGEQPSAEEQGVASTMGRGKRIDRRSIKVLEDWLRRNQADPYPSFEEKKLLCINTGLKFKQVTNWFINRRSKIKEQKEKSRKPHSFF